jgi:hypothetical protein
MEKTLHSHKTISGMNPENSGEEMTRTYNHDEGEQMKNRINSGSRCKDERLQKLQEIVSLSG